MPLLCGLARDELDLFRERKTLGTSILRGRLLGIQINTPARLVLAIVIRVCKSDDTRIRRLNDVEILAQCCDILLFLRRKAGLPRLTGPQIAIPPILSCVLSNI